MKKLLLTLLCLTVVTSAFGVFRAADGVIVPAVAKTAGGGDTFWQSDATIANPNGFDVYLRIRYIPSGPGGYATAPEAYTHPSALAAGDTITFADIMGTLNFAEEGFGFLVVEAFDVSDNAVPVIVTSRTYTPNPNGDGTYGQGIPGLPWYFFADPGYDTEMLNVLHVFDIETSDDYRTNLGVINISQSSGATITVELYDDAGTMVDSNSYGFGPMEHRQFGNVLASEFGIATGTGYHAVVYSTDTGAVMAYGSKVDWGTGDPTYLEAAFGVMPDVLCIWAQD